MYISVKQIFILRQKVWRCWRLVVGPYDGVQRLIGGEGGGKAFQRVLMDTDISVDKDDILPSDLGGPVVAGAGWPSGPSSAGPEPIGCHYCRDRHG